MREIGNSKAFAEACAAAAAAMAEAGKAQPDGWAVTTNVLTQYPGTTWITIPREGTLSISFDRGSGHARAVVVHGGRPGIRVVPLEPGATSLAVRPGDALIFQLASPATDRFDLVYSLS
jgi:hypothetical protein